MAAVVWDYCDSRSGWPIWKLSWVQSSSVEVVAGRSLVSLRVGHFGGFGC